ncbi:MAG: hypothetical protein QGI09_06945, partial [Dehalococcoidia bacterium]|nr:hypothetical protein [Dehalococcoidia bacterium]
DRQVAPAAEKAPAAVRRVQKAVIALASEAARPLVQGLEARLGMPIRLWQRLDSEVGAPAVSKKNLDLAQRLIAESPGDRVLLIIDTSDIRVIPYRDR